MPAWSIDTNAGSLVTREPQVVMPPITGVKPVGPVFNKDASPELTERLNAAAKRNRETAAHAEPGLVVGTDESSASFSVIAEARKLIEEEEYLAALRVIAPLIRTSPKDSQLTQVRLDIREAMEDDVLDEVVERQGERDFAGALSLLNELLQLDPAVGIYHCARVQTLLRANRLEEASASAQQAAEYCHGSEKQILDDLQSDVTRRRLDAALEPARQFYRAVKYRKARKAMDETRAQWSHEPLWQVFRAYLEDLGGNLFWSGRKPAEVKPAGEFRFVDRLHFFLVREEIALGKQLLDDDPEGAGDVLRRALELAPHFPYLNYLLGAVAYGSIIRRIGDDDFDLGEAESAVGKAYEFAKIGVTDSEIESAPALLESVESLSAAIAEAKRRLADRKRQMEQHFEPLVAKFMSFLEDVQNGIETTEQFRRLQKILRNIRGAIPPARKRVTDESVAEYLKQLGEVVEQHWEQLRAIEKQVDVIEKLIAARDRLRTILDPAAGHLVGSRVSVALQQMTKLHEEITRLRASPIPEDMRESVDEFRDEILDMKVVAPVLAQLNETMDNVSHISSPADLVSLRRRLQEVRSSASTCRGKLKTKAGRASVDQLLNMTGQLLAGVGG